MKYDKSTLLLGLLVVLVAGAAVAIVTGQPLVAGVLFLAISMTIFFRERDT